ncbi:ThiF family protein [Drepanopeziza brunnea f. sp. 'multigermtubi' MB_m1]|uniref:Ubiquitin-like 1-activating enzyme E1A n=1 Tax=Marssonina brunnea f. sp. multigermtubi (strain MB_m1) TaxID=1072389 RepID=K1Y200_MARBU|nr:ThiF family protein [Drepanopeziza brunnea f. sp. 'multigermtubi' MB_m1]EKD19134.1 ThiF family protein [Drepanopeziza brunnea f. sp. 'multigermtubi' MB_m1]
MEAVTDAPALPAQELSNPPIAPSVEAGISADEIALYDRQIRLWGVQAQEKIRNANILLITMKALANEIAKNLVLAGIHSLTVVDHENITENDLGSQFFISESDVGMNRAEAAAPQIRKLNPRVSVIVDQENVKEKSPDYFGRFDVVIATDLLPDSLNIINTATRINHKAFYAAGVHGFYGFIFSDLIQHDYLVEREKGNRATVKGPETRTRSVVDVKVKKEGGKNVEMVTKRELYSTWFLASDAASLPVEFLKSRRRLKAVTPILSCLRALWEFLQMHNGQLPSNAEHFKTFTRLATQKHKALGLPEETLRSEVLRKFLQNLGSEIAPVTAVLGGQLAQDVINVLGARQQPIQNMVVLDGDSMEAPMYALHPEGMLGEALLPLSVGAGNGAMVDGILPINGMHVPPGAIQI